MTKERFIVIMTALKERLKARDEFLDMTYEFCGDRFFDMLFDKFDMIRDYLYLIEDEVCAAVDLERENLSTDWLYYFVFDCECCFSEMKVCICQEPFPIECWSDVWDFYVELAR